MCDWKLPWHYLSIGPCLLSDAASGKDYLKDILKEENLHPLLDCKQPPNTKGFPPLIAAVREIGMERQERVKGGDSGVARHVSEFDWTHLWPTGLQVEVRSFDHDTYGDFILTHDTLYIRDPRKDKPCGALPKTFEAEKAFYSGRFMLVVDYMVMSEKGREYFSADGDKGGEAPCNGDAKAKVLHLLRDCRDGVPDGIKLEVKDMPTTETEIAWCNGEFVLRLGWNWDATKDAALPDDSIGGIEDIDFCGMATFTIPQWPCGAFE